MKFTLTYDDVLPATGNSSKPDEVGRIRNYFHDQLADLWVSHVVLRELVRTARFPLVQHYTEASTPPRDYSSLELSEYNEPIPPLEPGHKDLCASIKKGTLVAYRPLIRKSLHLACALDINFLRQEDPGSLVLQGGDIDGRMKTLFDALRMPTHDEEKAAGITPTADPLECLLESDTLISDLSIKTGRLLGARTKTANHVQLTIDVTVKVLRVFLQNQCLIGG